MVLEVVKIGGVSPNSLCFSSSVTKSPFVPPNLKTVVFPLTPQRKLRGLFTATTKRNPKRLKYSEPRISRGELLYVEVDQSGDDTWKLEPIVKLLKEGAVGVIPTDTVIKEIETSKPLSILCHSLRDIDTYTLGFPRGNGQGSTNVFRVVKHCLPGPYTFILPASKELPKQCIRNGTTPKYAARKTVGIRMPDDAVCQAILEEMGAPLMSTSVKWAKGEEWILDPVAIADVYGPMGIDFVVAAGVRVADPSTVVDMTGDSPTIIRQGKGPKQDWMIVKDDEDSTMSDS
ncbi:hypothetical protein MKX01_025757 [Papaver californicum]|nr:hypothetical protein MKX01_025757 [Papaver californicum]